MKLSYPFSVLLILFSICVNAFAIELIDRPTSGRQYETLTFRFNENLKFENPFDLETNRMELHIQQPDFSRRVLSFIYDGLNEKGTYNPNPSGMDFPLFWLAPKYRADLN